MHRAIGQGVKRPCFVPWWQLPLRSRRAIVVPMLVACYHQARFRMRPLILVLLILAVACLAFAYWGLATPGGRRAFDEMAGIVPAAAGCVGVVFLVAGGGLWFWTWFSRRKKDTSRSA